MSLPYSADKGYLIGGIYWFATPVSLAMALGLASTELMLAISAPPLLTIIASFKSIVTSELVVVMPVVRGPVGRQSVTSKVTFVCTSKAYTTTDPCVLWFPAPSLCTYYPPVCEVTAVFTVLCCTHSFAAQHIHKYEASSARRPISPSSHLIPCDWIVA